MSPKMIDGHESVKYELEYSVRNSLINTSPLVSYELFCGLVIAIAY